MIAPAQGEVRRKGSATTPAPTKYRYTWPANAEANPQSPVQMPGVLTYTHFTTVVIAAFVPLAAGLYLLVSTSWALGERLVLRRFLPDGAPVGQDPVS